VFCAIILHYRPRKVYCMDPLVSAVEQSLRKANVRLKGTGVTLEVRGSNQILNVRGTFPPKPFTQKSQPYQQRIPLHNDHGAPVKAQSVAAVQWAEQQAKRISADLNLGKFSWDDWVPEEKKVKVDLLSLWDQYTAHKSSYLEVTSIHGDYRRVRNHLLKMRDSGVEIGVGGLHCRDYLLEHNTPKTARRIIMMLGSCCTWAVERSLIPDNPFTKMASSIKVTKAKAVDPFTPEEINLIIDAFAQYRPHYLPYVKFLFLTGCRSSEANGLYWSSVDLPNRTVKFETAYTGGVEKGTKTGYARSMPISPKLAEVLESIKPTPADPKELVFKAPRGGRINGVNFLNSIWNPMLEKAGVRYRCQYQTRHTFASNALQSGCSVAQVSQWLGHSQVILLSHYSGVLTKQQEVPEPF